VISSRDTTAARSSAVRAVTGRSAHRIPLLEMWAVITCYLLRRRSADADHKVVEEMSTQLTASVRK
jgi:hypothetical protein